MTDRKTKDPHDVLGVSAGASESEIKVAYRRLAKRWHPDRGAGADADRFREVQQAYETLSDTAHRRDREAAAGESIPVRYGPAPASGRSSSFHEVFPRRLGLEIRLSPGEAARGGRVVFEAPLEERCFACSGSGEGFFLLCLECGGRGIVRSYRAVEFLIPAGVEHGAVLTGWAGGGAPVQARIVVERRGGF